MCHVLSKFLTSNSQGFNPLTITHYPLPITHYQIPICRRVPPSSSDLTKGGKHN